ncbi:flagellar hook protein FlgE [Granulicella aggregans]|uniref:Flagellar hook protein FlgE n=1 Tax=Granulicella aggregans TaxID=474949 RepID=A0A7W7ZAN9_9BACT|nr:flagellar hook protein FlgE [Granulicella aggregans]MBB5056393.1 flagellar hook protein FlgE [Granulicella aggregans]
MSFFGVPLSGLIASQDQLSSVSNNLANLDTVGFKDQTTSFSDLFAQSSVVNATNDPIQTGLGVLPAQTYSNFTDGATSATGIDTNMALTGNGLFVVKSTDGTIKYTRAGDFTTNAAGYLTTPNGELVMGYVSANGTNATSGVLQPLKVGLGTTTPAIATTSFQLAGNLSSGAAVGSTYSSPTSIYDSLGTSHVLTVNYTKTAANTWSYTVDVPKADTGAASTTVSSGSLTFDSSGNLTSTTDSAGVVTSPPGSVSISIPSYVDGASGSTLSWNLTNSSGAGSITQTSLANSFNSPIQNGQASGTLSSISVLADGTIEGIFSNSQSSAIGQVAVASFANNQGLLRTGSNDYQATVGSGAAAIGTAETGGRGTITGGSVESSNVDVATEFSKMIEAQQAYSANAKAVTTFQQISQATIQMITG